MKISDTRLLNLKQVLAEKKMRLIDLADILGKAPAQVSAFAGKNPTKGIGNQIAREIEHALGLHSGYLDMSYVIGEFGKSAVSHGEGRKLPVLDSVMAIAWCEKGQASEPSAAQEWIDAPGPVGPRAFVLRVHGVSMEPKFTENDKVVIDPALTPSSGQFVVAKRKKEDAVRLRLLTHEGSDQYLCTLNSDWPDRITKITADWTILGIARWLISDLS